jgi:hypothetical protein
MGENVPTEKNGRGGRGGVSQDNITSFADAKIARHRRRYPWQEDYLLSLVTALQKLPREARLDVIVSACDSADWRAITELDPKDIWGDDDGGDGDQPAA